MIEDGLKKIITHIINPVLVLILSSDEEIIILKGMILILIIKEKIPKNK